MRNFKNTYMKIEPEDERKILDDIINFIKTSDLKMNRSLIPYLDDPFSFRLSLDQFKIITDAIFKDNITNEELLKYLALLNNNSVIPNNQRYAKKYYDYIAKKITDKLLERGYYTDDKVFSPEYAYLIYTIIAEYPDIAEKYFNKINFRNKDLVTIYTYIRDNGPVCCKFSYRDYDNAFLINGIYDQIIVKKGLAKYSDRSKYQIYDRLFESGEFYDKF